MNHLPGRILTEADLDGLSGASVIPQIAHFNTLWRMSVPSVSMFGNIRHQLPREAGIGGLEPYGRTPLNQIYTVGGFVQCHRYEPAIIKTAPDYYTYMFNDQIYRVMTCEAYHGVRRHIVPLIADFVDRDLPLLTFARQKDGETLKAVFSHMDLAPRNVLVEEDERGELKVTEIVDFEFASFLPQIDEFVNAYVRQEGDWTEKHYTVLLQEMARLGCKVPPLDGLEHGMTTFTKHEWEEACVLWKLIDNIAPWYIMEGKMSNEVLGKELDTAGKIVGNCIKHLQKLRLVEQERQEPEATILEKIVL